MTRWKHAFSLSKAEVEDAIPPGTVMLVEHHLLSSGEDIPRQEDQIVKFPAPSTDPADPLNWPAWRKTALLLVASFYPFVANFTSSSIAPALQLWNFTFPSDPRPYPELVHLIAVSVLFLGAANIWWVPLSNWAGRRPVLLVATLLMTLSTMWCGLATSYDSLFAARVFQGIGGAAADTIAPALVGDVYFMDERGRAMSIYTVFLCAGSLVGGLAGGYIGFHLGWAYIFWIGTALSGACFVGMLFLVPETMYLRMDAPQKTSQDPSRGVKEAEAEAQSTHVEDTLPDSHRPYNFTRSLGCSRPRGSLLNQFIQPWVTLALPGTWVVMVHYAGLVGGIVTISVVGAQLMAMPPYNWGANAGLINVGALIGIVLGVAYTYLVSDSRLKRRAKKEGRGVAEPEARLPTMFPALVIATAGFFVFGFCAKHPGPGRWVGLQVGYGMIAFGLMQLPSVGFNYIIDAYTYRAADCFVIITILRAIIAFAWTFFVAEWVEKKGADEAFGIFGMLMGLFSLLTVPLWLYGKRMRIATATLFEK